MRSNLSVTDKECIKAVFDLNDVLQRREAEPVRHGRWIVHQRMSNNWCECSECNTVGSPQWKRCPVCEAKMDGDGDDQA
jgi:uncharacterized paraquat-inducible protein A